MSNLLSKTEIKELNGRFEDYHEVIAEVESLIGRYNKVVNDRDEAEEWFKEILEQDEVDVYSNLNQSFIVELKEIEPTCDANAYFIPQVKIWIDEYYNDPGSVDYAYCVRGGDYEG